MEAERTPITVRRIGPDQAADIRLPNEPFPLRGRLRVRYDGAAFTWEEDPLPEGGVTYQTFPDEDYDYAAMQATHFFVGAYRDGRCVGLAIFEKPWNRWLYLSDLKVCRSARRQGAARALLREGLAIAREQGYQGVSTICQDNNLNAALFYLRSGFQIGGLDTRVYDGTKQAGKSDIFLYHPL